MTTEDMNRIKRASKTAVKNAPKDISASTISRIMMIGTIGGALITMVTIAKFAL